MRRNICRLHSKRRGRGLSPGPFGMSPRKSLEPFPIMRVKTLCCLWKVEKLPRLHHRPSACKKAPEILRLQKGGPAFWPLLGKLLLWTPPPPKIKPPKGNWEGRPFSNWHGAGLSPKALGKPFGATTPLWEGPQNLLVSLQPLGEWKVGLPWVKTLRFPPKCKELENLSEKLGVSAWKQRPLLSPRVLSAPTTPKSALAIDKKTGLQVLV